MRHFGTSDSCVFLLITIHIFIDFHPVQAVVAFSITVQISWFFFYSTSSIHNSLETSCYFCGIESPFFFQVDQNLRRSSDGNYFCSFLRKCLPFEKNKNSIFNISPNTTIFISSGQDSIVASPPYIHCWSQSVWMTAKNTPPSPNLQTDPTDAWWNYFLNNRNVQLSVTSYIFLFFFFVLKTDRYNNNCICFVLWT